MNLKRTGNRVARQDIELFKDLEMGRINQTDFTVYNVLHFLCGVNVSTEMSLGTLSGKTHLSPVTLRKCLRRLHKSGWIDLEDYTAPKPLIITVKDHPGILRVD